jgi:hypothetical protein
MQSLFVAWYNSGRKHEALKGKTPAMASQLTDHVWTIKELIERAATLLKLFARQLGCLLSIVGGLFFGVAALYGCAHMYDVRPPEEDNFPWVFYSSAGVTLIGLICVLFRRLIDKII